MTYELSVPVTGDGWPFVQVINCLRSEVTGRMQMPLALYIPLFRLWIPIRKENKTRQIPTIPTCPPFPTIELKSLQLFNILRNVFVYFLPFLIQ